MMPSSAEDNRGAATGKMTISRTDLYKSYSPTQRQLILASGAIVALLTPFCDTVYLPALQQVTDELNTTTQLTSITVSAYLGAVGIGQVVWGPLSDYYGRLIVLFGTLLVFEAFTIACIFAQDIISLIVLRAIEGFIVGSCIVSVQAIIADVFSPETRGAALGYFLGPMLIGPIIAPLVGGILAQVYTWRADFVLLAVMTVPITLFAYMFTPETHHWYVLKDEVRTALIVRMKEEEESERCKHEENVLTQVPTDTSNSEDCPAICDHTAITVDDPNGQSISDITVIDPAVEEHVNDADCRQVMKNSISTDTCLSIENSSGNNSSENNSGKDLEEQFEGGSKEHIDHIPEATVTISDDVSDIAPPVLIMPWTVAAFMFDPELSAYYAAVGLGFGTMLTSLTLLPIHIVKAPYSLSESIIGVTFLPAGVAMLLAAVAGGVLSDWSGARYPHTPHGGMIACLLLSCICPFGTVGFGFALQAGNPLYIVLISQSIIGFGQAISMPATLAFLSTVRPDSAGATGSTMLFLCFLIAAIFIAISTEISALIGVGYYCLIIAALSALANVISLYICIYNIYYLPSRALSTEKTFE